MQYLRRALTWLITTYIPMASLRNHGSLLLLPQSPISGRAVSLYFLHHLCVVSCDDPFARKDLCAEIKKLFSKTQPCWQAYKPFCCSKAGAIWYYWYLVLFWSLCRSQLGSYCECHTSFLEQDFLCVYTWTSTNSLPNWRDFLSAVPIQNILMTESCVSTKEEARAYFVFSSLLRNSSRGI